MAGNHGIPPILHTAVLERSAAGSTLLEIVAWLQEEHKVKTSRSAVHALVQKLRVERSDQVKAFVQREIVPRLGKDLSALNLQRIRLSKLCTLIYNKVIDNPEVEGLDAYNKTVEQLRKVVDTKLHYSGADANPTPVDEIETELNRRLDSLEAALGTPEAIEPTGPNTERATGPTLQLEVLGQTRPANPRWGLVNMANLYRSGVGQNSNCSRVHSRRGQSGPSQEGGPGWPYNPRRSRRND